jgi:hypothetical protein
MQRGGGTLPLAKWKAPGKAGGRWRFIRHQLALSVLGVAGWFRLSFRRMAKPHGIIPARGKPLSAPSGDSAPLVLLVVVAALSPPHPARSGFCCRGDFSRISVNVWLYFLLLT